MAVNRYTEFNPQPYVSTYVPLPLDTMYQALASKQKAYDKAEEDEMALSDLQSKIKSLEQVDAFGQSYSVGDRQYVKQYFQNLNKELETKADELVKGDKASSEYQAWLKKKARELNQEMSSGNLARIQSAYDTYTEQQKAIAEAKDLGISPWRALQIEQNRRAYGESQGFGSGESLSKYNVGEYVDRNKEMDDLSKGINEELTKIYANPDNQGYIRTGKISEITEPKIIEMFRGFLPNSKTDLDIREEIKYEIQSGQLDPKDASAAYNQKVTNIENALISKYRMSKGDADLKVDSWLMYKDKQAVDEERLYPKQQTKEGRTSKFMSNKLDALGVIADDGTFDITKIKSTNIDDFIKGFTSTLTMYNPADAAKMKERLTGKVSYEDKQKAIAMAFNDMARFLGINNYKVKRSAADDPNEVADYNDILKAYSQFQESRGTALAYDERVSPGYSKQLNEEPTNYTYYDENGTELSGSTRDELINDKKKVVTGRDYVPTSKGAKFAQEFKTSDGKTYYAQYKGDIEKNHYDALSNIISSQNQFIKNYRSGDKLTVSHSFNFNTASKIATDLKQNSPVMQGFDVATVDKSPDGQHIVVTKINPENPLEMYIDRYKYDGKHYMLTDYNVSTKDFVSQTDSDYGRSEYSYVKGYNYNKSGTSTAFDTMPTQP